MRKSKFYLGTASMLIAGLFASCSDHGSMPDEPNKPADDKAKVYMNINITSSVSKGTRSETDDNGDSSGGTEIGQTSENTISNVMVLLVGRDNDNKDACFIAKWTKSFNNLNIETEQTVTADFDRSAILDHYDAHREDSKITDPTKVRIYVVCNYTPEINNLIGNPGQGADVNKWIKNGVVETKKLTGEYYSKSDMPFWLMNHFLMTNAEIYDQKIPDEATIMDNKKYNSPLNAFSLTDPDDPVIVERAVARFDYAPYIEDTDASGNLVSQVKGKETKDYYYEYNPDPNDTSTETFQIRLRRMSLVNMNKAFYLFKRVSDDGTPNEKDNNFSIGGKENRKNYVIDPYWEFKKDVSNDWDKSEFTKKFYYYVKDFQVTNTDVITNEAWDSYDISEIISDEVNQHDGTYHFWRYVIPNTIPGSQLQKNGISTGIVFKAKIDPSNKEGEIGKRMTAGDDIFAFNGQLLGSWYDVAKKASDSHADAELKLAYETAVKAEASLKWETVKDKEASVRILNKAQTAAAVKEGGFAKYGYVNGYDANQKGYYCYYYYWNRHNDNGDPNRMGPMEFGVVRNNIYKLHVTRINRLGHPFQPDNDPDPIQPEDPDETSKLYMNVSVKVLPWTVRKNNIDF